MGRSSERLKHPKTLGVNIRIYEEMPSGIQNFITGLFSKFLKSQFEYQCIFFTLGRKRIEDTARYVRSSSPLLSLIRRIDPILVNIFFDNLYILKLILKYRIEVFYTPSYILPIFKPKGIKFVTTVHDLYFFNYKHNPLKIYRNYVLYMKVMLPLTLKRADRVVVDSRYVKRQLKDIYRIPDHKIKVIYGGKDDFFFQMTGGKIFSKIKRKYKITERYIFSTATNQERKNTLGLIEAYSNLETRDFILVISGLLPKINVIELNAFIKKLNLTDRVKFLGFVPKEDLRLLYSFAKLFVYPSFEEGFGLPILEAASCNCLPVSSNAGSLPEVVGNKYLLFNPRNITEMSAKIDEFLIASPQKYEYYLKGVQKNIKKFDWEKTANEYKNLFRSL